MTASIWRIAIISGMLCGLATASPSFASSADARPQAESAPCAQTPADGGEPCASEAEAKERENIAKFTAAYVLPLADELAGAGDARNLALAASLRRYALKAVPAHAQDDDARSIEWQRRALAQMRDDPLVAMLVLADRESPQDPIGAQALQRWRDATPQNLVPLLLAETDGDEILRAARTMRRFDHGFIDLLRLVLDAVDRHPPSAQALSWLRAAGGRDGEIAALTIGTNLSMAIMPRFSPIMSACIKQVSPAQSERWRDCRHVGALLAESSDTAIAAMIGWSILRYAPDAPTRANAKKQRRQLRWRLRQWETLRECAAPGTDAPRFAAILRAHPELGEEALMREHLLAAGMVLEPPADWSDERVSEPACSADAR